MQKIPNKCSSMRVPRKCIMKMLDSLNDPEIVLYMTIVAHANDDGICELKNKEIGTLLSKTEYRASNLINSLKRKGFIDMLYSDGGKERKIYV